MDCSINVNRLRDRRPQRGEPGGDPLQAIGQLLGGLMQPPGAQMPMGQGQQGLGSGDGMERGQPRRVGALAAPRYGQKRPRGGMRAGDFQSSRELRRGANPRAANPRAAQPTAQNPRARNTPNVPNTQNAPSPRTTDPRAAGPRATNIPAAPSGHSPQDRLYRAIVGQESGGRNIVNPHSGATGIGQVMPANIRAWSREVLGYPLTPAQFRARPDLQQRIVQAKLGQYYQEGLRRTGNEREAVRYAAAKWYSGNGELRNSTRPQRSAGHSYPSIYAYTQQVLRRYQGT